jgi:hypothetical protein
VRKYCIDHCSVETRQHPSAFGNNVSIPALLMHNIFQQHNASIEWKNDHVDASFAVPLPHLLVVVVACIMGNCCGVGNRKGVAHPLYQPHTTPGQGLLRMTCA